jgi:hypothetical protein
MFHEMLSARNLMMATVFWGRKGVPMVEFMQQGTTVMSLVYCRTLNRNCVELFTAKGVE